MRTLAEVSSEDEISSAGIRTCWETNQGIAADPFVEVSVGTIPSLPVC